MYKQIALLVALAHVLLATAYASSETMLRQCDGATCVKRDREVEVMPKACAWTLLPVPRTIKFHKGTYAITGRRSLSFNNVRHDAVDQLKAHAYEALGSAEGRFGIDPEKVPNPQGYVLDITRGGIKVVAHDEPGLFYALMTLRQLARHPSTPRLLPRVHIEDWPDFHHRGVLLDISRDKVPEMDTLYGLVDKLAGWKFNQLQLYTEHVFAYRDHPTVWQDASPMTPAQVRALDAYCKARYVELVPNQNSFGHMDRWLKHAQYQHLGEMPGGGADLCPVDPACEAFLVGLYADLLPNFSSSKFNVCCDETWSLGKGRSKQAVEEKGLGRVYLDFLLEIRRLVQNHGRVMLFWGDIVMQHPEVIPELPKDVTVLEWGYEAGHPFAEHARKLADSGIPFYVVPGTSSWNSLAGRTDNAIANLSNAARNGLAYGAIGYLVTDWGDGGHWQFLPISYLGFAYGAAVSWAYEANKDVGLPAALDAHVFEDDAGVMGRLAYDLGNAYQLTGVSLHNNTLFYLLLQHAVEGPTSQGALKAMSEEGLRKTLEYLDKVMAWLPEARMRCPDAELIAKEFRLTAALMGFACHLGLARLEAGGVGTSELGIDVRLALARELERLIPEHRQLWLARNRSGGLKDSSARLENLLAILRSK